MNLQPLPIYRSDAPYLMELVMGTQHHITQDYAPMRTLQSLDQQRINDINTLLESDKFSDAFKQILRAQLAQLVDEEEVHQDGDEPAAVAVSKEDLAKVSMSE